MGRVKYAKAETAIAGHDLIIAEWLSFYGVFDSTTVAVSVVKF